MTRPGGAAGRDVRTLRALVDLRRPPRTPQADDATASNLKARSLPVV
jgi:hypothetical protein